MVQAYLAEGDAVRIVGGAESDPVSILKNPEEEAAPEDPVVESEVPQDAPSSEAEDPIVETEPAQEPQSSEAEE